MRRTIITLILTLTLTLTALGCDQQAAAAQSAPPPTLVQALVQVKPLPALEWPYTGHMILTNWNATHPDPITAQQAQAVAVWLNRIVSDRLGQYLFAVWLAHLPRDVPSIVRAAAVEFGVPADAFLRVIRCESQFNPLSVNRSSGALGLGQHLPQYWGGRAAALGYPYSAWSDPTANARVSAWLWATSGPQNWVCY